MSALNQIISSFGFSGSLSHVWRKNLFTIASAGSGRAFAYDHENQCVTAGGFNAYNKSDFVYDGKGRLRRRLDYTWAWNGTYYVWTSTGETRYVYDGMLLLQERTSAGHPTVTYTRGLDLSGSLEGAGGIGGLLARTAHSSTSPYQPSTSAYYHADGNGNVTYLLNQARTHGASYRYDPYGRLIASSGGLASANLMRFSSKPWHDHSETYYYGYRFYLPEGQRWPNRDPIGERGGINLYGFVGNSPINRVDFLGLDFTNGGSRPVYVIKDGQWILVKPGETVTGDTDGFSIGTNPLTGKADAFKWIDCYDVKITDNDGSDPKVAGPIVVHLTWVGNKHTDGKHWKRKCVCAIPRVAWNEQQKRGGQKPDAQAEFGSNPPPQLDEWTAK